MVFTFGRITIDLTEEEMSEVYKRYIEIQKSDISTQDSNDDLGDKLVWENNVNEEQSCELYVDGTAKGNPGEGGYCAILVLGGKETIAKGHESDTTVSAMKLKSLAEGLKLVPDNYSVKVCLDFKAVVDMINAGVIEKWAAANWIIDETPVKNAEVWKEIYNEMEMHKVEFCVVDSANCGVILDRAKIEVQFEIKSNISAAS